MTLEDSTTYQLILKRGETRGAAQGRLDEARGIVVRLGTKKFGTPPPAALDAVADRERLERIADRILDAASWDDLLATP